MENLINTTIGRYEVFTIIDNNKITNIIGNEYEVMKQWYNDIVNKLKNDNKHIIVALFDYDKNTNIEYYDNRDELL